MNLVLKFQLGIWNLGILNFSWFLIHPLKYPLIIIDIVAIKDPGVKAEQASPETARIAHSQASFASSVQSPEFVGAATSNMW